MADPLKLAEEIERRRPPYVNADERDARLLAAALRLAEGTSDNDFPRHPTNMDGDPILGAGLYEMLCPLCERARQDGHADDCPHAAYRAAREGR